MVEVVRVGAAFAVREVSSVVQADPFMSFLLRAVKLSSGSNGAESWCLGLASNVAQDCFKEMHAGVQTMTMCGAGGKDVYAAPSVRMMGDAPCLGTPRVHPGAKPYLEP